MSAIGGYEMSNEITSTLALVYRRQACSFYSSDDTGSEAWGCRRGTTCAAFGAWIDQSLQSRRCCVERAPFHLLQTRRYL